jgi:hypothetical protein
MLVTWVARPISATPVISPSAAVISGIPAARSDPNVKSRITSAATAPISVAGPTLKPSAFATAWPPAATLRPRTCTAFTWSRIGLAAAFGSTLAGWLKLIVANAVLPSREISTAPRGSYGLRTETTCRTSLTCASSLVIAARTAGSLTVPFSVWNTIVSASPLAVGNSFLSRSSARCDSVPGRLKFVA